MPKSKEPPITEDVKNWINWYTDQLLQYSKIYFEKAEACRKSGNKSAAEAYWERADECQQLGISLHYQIYLLDKPEENEEPIDLPF